MIAGVSLYVCVRACVRACVYPLLFAYLVLPLLCFHSDRVTGVTNTRTRAGAPTARRPGRGVHKGPQEIHEEC